MPTVPCPNCRIPLNLPESLRGSEVQCPHCQTVFTAPAREEVTARPIPREAAPAPPSQRDPSSDFNFQDEAGSRPTGRINRRTHGPANWMRTAAISEFVLSSCCFIVGCAGLVGPLGPIRGDEAGVVAGVLIGGGTLQVGLGIITLLGARALSTQRNYGLAMAGCITALVLGLKNLLQLAVSSLQLLGAIIQFHPGFLAVFCGAFILVLVAAIGDWLGGIQGLLALSNDKVKAAFR